MLSSSDEDDGDKKVYCICRSSDVTRFMIGCDGCTDWFHGDCVNVSEKEAKYIKKYYCKRCRRSNPTLAVVYKTKYKEYLERKAKERKEKLMRKLAREKERISVIKSDDDDDDEDEERKKAKEAAELKASLHAERKKMREEMKKKKEEKISVDSDRDEPPQVVVRKHPVLSESNASDVDDVDDSWEPAVVVVPKPKSSSKARKRGQPLTSSTTKRSYAKVKRRRRDSSSSEEESSKLDDGPQQCYGPRCVKSARINSKYCSDQCGINLATARIYETLPPRIREWNMTPSAAEKASRKELEGIREKQNGVQNRLGQLHNEFRQLEEVIAKGKSMKVEDNSDEEDEDVSENTATCVTCGTNVQLHSAVRHMERCYNKFESRTSFASKFKTQIEDSRMFCDFYNPKEQTYCKRLRVLCPEHNPDPKIGDDEVCGFPLQKKLFDKPSSFCLKAKKTCQMHFCWEKLRRAEIDMERVKQWMKVDELIEQERQIKMQMSNRAGVLGLMLHSTYDHEMGERMKKMMMQAQKLQQHKQHQSLLK